MHLDILYKSVGFISGDKILAILDDYKTAKEEKRKEALAKYNRWSLGF